jgi:hypothetical protein
MRRIKIVGLCLVAVFAMGAVLSSTASAVAPEYGQCLKQATKSLSNYDSSKCIKIAGEDTGTEAEKLKKGNYQWFPGVIPGKNKFETNGGVATLTTVKGEQVTCETEHSTGEYIEGGNNKEEKTVVEFAGCKSAGLTCTTAGEPAGHLVTNELIGVVAYEKTPENNFKARKTVLELHPGPTALNHHFIDFKCTSALSIEVRGTGGTELAGILVKIKNDAMKFEETLKYTQSGGIQKPSAWVPPGGGFPNPTQLESNFQGTGFNKSGQTIESKVKNLEGVKYELNAFL